MIKSDEQYGSRKFELTSVPNIWFNWKRYVEDVMDEILEKF